MMGSRLDDPSEMAVRVPASSANLGPGFDVLGMALDIYADIGVGVPPTGSQQLDEHHPASIAFAELGGIGTLWSRSSIPMGRGLGFSGAVRVGGAAQAVIQGATNPAGALGEGADAILEVATRLEGHGDNVAASFFGGVVASVRGQALPVRVGPELGAAAVVVWIPEVTTSTDRSRAALSATVDRRDVTHNLAAVVQLVLAIEHDDPSLLAGATDDLLHQPARLPLVPGASAALESGVEAGAWCGWLSGSGPTVALLCARAAAPAVVEAMPDGGHCKTLRIDTEGTRLVGHSTEWSMG